MTLLHETSCHAVYHGVSVSLATGDDALLGGVKYKVEQQYSQADVFLKVIGNIP